MDLPLSNVLSFYLDEDQKFIARPSGTEPKIKFYIEVKGRSHDDCEYKIKRIKEYIDSLI